MRLRVVNYWSYVNNPIPDQAEWVSYAEKTQLEEIRFPLTIRIPSKLQRSTITSSDECRFLHILKMSSLSRHLRREDFSESAVSALMKFLDLPAERKTSCVDEALQKLAVHTGDGMRPQKWCSVRHSGQTDVLCPLYSTSLALLDIHSWQELCQLKFANIYPTYE